MFRFSGINLCQITHHDIECSNYMTVCSEWVTHSSLSLSLLSFSLSHTQRNATESQIIKLFRGFIRGRRRRIMTEQDQQNNTCFFTATNTGPFFFFFSAIYYFLIIITPPSTFFFFRFVFSFMYRASSAINNVGYTIFSVIFIFRLFFIIIMPLLFLLCNDEEEIFGNFFTYLFVSRTHATFWKKRKFL